VSLRDRIQCTACDDTEVENTRVIAPNE